MSKSITVLILSDLHVGHNAALWPYPKEQNGPQKFLWKCWNEVINQAVDEKPKILIVNGDLTDGPQAKSRGVEATTALVGHQQTACVDLLRPLASVVSEIYITRGTPYHDGELGAITEPIAQALGAVRTRSGEHTATTWDLEIGGIKTSIHHEVPGGAGLNRGAQLLKESIFAHLTGNEGIGLIIRSHLHYFIHIELPSQHLVSTPCWQLSSHFMERKSPYRMVPDIGAVWVDLFPGEADPIRIRKQLFELPLRKPVRSQV